MLTFDDCLSYCGLTEDEVDVIVLREKITGLAAIAFAQRVVRAGGGTHTTCDILATEMD